MSNNEPQSKNIEINAEHKENISCPYDYKADRKKYERQKAEFIDDLPDKNVFIIDGYKQFDLNRYWWDADSKRLIMLTRGRYKYVNPTKTNGLYIVVLIDTNGKSHTCSYKKLYSELCKLN